MTWKQQQGAPIRGSVGDAEERVNLPPLEGTCGSLTLGRFQSWKKGVTTERRCGRQRLPAAGRCPAYWEMWEVDGNQL